MMPVRRRDVDGDVAVMQLVLTPQHRNRVLQAMEPVIEEVEYEQINQTLQNPVECAPRGPIWRSNPASGCGAYGGGSHETDHGLQQGCHGEVEKCVADVEQDSFERLTFLGVEPSFSHEKNQENP